MYKKIRKLDFCKSAFGSCVLLKSANRSLMSLNGGEHQRRAAVDSSHYLNGTSE